MHRDLCVLAVDHRHHLEAVADRFDGRGRLPRFKQLAVEAAAGIEADGCVIGVICDANYGSSALLDAAEAGLWVGRTIEVGKSKPVQFMAGPDIVETLQSWPREQTVKCLCFYSAGDSEAVKQAQDVALLRLDGACKSDGRRLLLEIIPYPDRIADAAEVAGAIRHLYALGVRPDWWKLEPRRSAGDWGLIDEAVREGDPSCRGILVLGLTSTKDHLRASLDAACTVQSVRGFAVGRTIIWDPFCKWIAGEAGDRQAMELMRDNFLDVIEAWDTARRPGRDRAPGSAGGRR